MKELRDVKDLTIHDVALRVPCFTSVHTEQRGARTRNASAPNFSALLVTLKPRVE